MNANHIILDSGEQLMTIYEKKNRRYMQLNARSFNADVSFVKLSHGHCAKLGLCRFGAFC